MERTHRPAPRYPSLYQVNTRVWLTELSRQLGRPATLDDVPDAELDRFAAQGFDWVWLLSVWQTGPAGQRVSRANPEWRREFEETLPDLTEEDIAGSGFAITGYTVSDALGGDAALARLRGRLTARGMRLMLDFVPNHTGSITRGWIDHPGVLRRRHRGGPGPGSRELHAGQVRRGRPGARARPRPVLPRLAGHAAARLRQSGASGSDDRASC